MATFDFIRAVNHLLNVDLERPLINFALPEFSLMSSRDTRIHAQGRWYRVPALTPRPEQDRIPELPDKYSPLSETKGERFNIFCSLSWQKHVKLAKLSFTGDSKNKMQVHLLDATDDSASKYHATWKDSMPHGKIPSHAMQD